MNTTVQSVAFREFAVRYLFKTAGLRWLGSVLLLLVDYMVIISTLIAASHIRAVLPNYLPVQPFIDIPPNYQYFVIPLIYIGLISYERLYTKRLPFLKNIELLFKISIYATGIISVIMYFSGDADRISRIFIALSCPLTFMNLVMWRYLSKLLLINLGLWQVPVVIVGTGKAVKSIVNALEMNPAMGYNIIGIIESNEDPVNKGPNPVSKYPCLGNSDNIEEIIRKHKIRDVIISVSDISNEDLSSLVHRIHPHVNNLTIIPDFFGIPMTNMEADTLFKERLIMLKLHNNLLKKNNLLLKRLFDILTGMVIFLVALPVMLIIAIIIKLDSKGPVIYYSNRVGKEGRKFRCYKFRTMYVNSDKVLEDYLAQDIKARYEWDTYRKLRHDPRVTKVGRWLRKTSLDELPQLINIIKGEMSLVGPRPITEEEVNKYSEFINDYYLVPPGLTGYWQISGRNNIDYDTRVRMDSWYVHNWSFWLDSVILLQTLKVVLEETGAY